MIDEYRKFYYTEIYKLFYEQLQKIANEHNLDINELEKEYLNFFKKYL